MSASSDSDTASRDKKKRRDAICARPNNSIPPVIVANLLPPKCWWCVFKAEFFRAFRVLFLIKLRCVPFVLRT